MRSTAGIQNSNSLKIAVFSDSYSPIVNGVSVSIDALVDELRARNHSVHIFTSGFRGHKDTDPNICRFPAIRLPFVPGYSFAVPPFYPTLRYFRRQRFDIIHTHTPYTVGFVGLRWAESHEIPVVSTYHTLYERYAHYIPYFPKAYVRYKTAKHVNYYYNRVRQVITPSEAALNSLRRQSVKMPITVIPTGNPSPRKMSRDEARSRIGARERERMLLYVGRIAKEKNITTLLEGIHLAMSENDEIRLWMVGDGSYRKEAQKFARDLGIGDRVRFVGAIPRAEVDAYYLAADLFTFASVTETQGLVIGEAMAHGVPAVAVRGGGASDAIDDGNNGIIVGNSPSQLSEAVLRVVGNPALLGRLAETARRTVKLWTHSDMADGVLGVYEAALRRPIESSVEQHEHSRAN